MEQEELNIYGCATGPKQEESLERDRNIGRGIFINIS